MGNSGSKILILTSTIVVLLATACQAKISTTIASKSCGADTKLADGTCSAKSGTETNSPTTSRSVAASTTMPGAFSLVSPYQDSLSWNTLPLITWTASAQATAYSVVIANDAACTSVIEQSSNQTATTYQVVGAMSVGQSYYVCLTASNSSGSLAASNSGYTIVIGLTSGQRFGPPSITFRGAMNFGIVMALSEDASTLVVGAPADGYDASNYNYLSNAGAAYVYIYQSGAWVLQQKLVPTGTNARNASDAFGSVVAISGDTVVVGTKTHQYDEVGGTQRPGAGAAWVFIRTSNVWTQQQKLVGTGVNGRNTNDNFATSIGISGDTVAIGAQYHSFDAAGTNVLGWAGAVFVFTRTSGTWSIQDRLVGQGTNGRVSLDQFGFSVAIYSDTIVVGAIFQDYDATGANSAANAGAAYVFVRSAGTWSFQQKLVGTGTNGRLASDQFGASVAIDTDTIAVGAITQQYDAAGNTQVASAGAVYIFLRTGATWAIQQKIVGTGTNGRIASDYFGTSVSLSGNTIAIGAGGQGYDAAGNNLLASAGAVYVWTRSGVTWTFEQKLVGFGTNGRIAADSFGGIAAGSPGAGVAVAGNYLVAGSQNQLYDENGVAAGPTYVGAAYSFTRSGATWSTGQKFAPTTSGVVPQASFGNVVAISADESTMVVGAYLDSYDANGANYVNGSGAVYVYIKQNSQWVLQQKIVPTGTNSRLSGNFGNSIGISGDTIVVGAENDSYDESGANFVNMAGAAYVYTRSSGVWTLQQKLVATGTNGRNGVAYFGHSVAIDGETAVVGAYRNGYDASGNNFLVHSGSAWVFTRSAGTWTTQQRLVATGTNARIPSDKFGSVVVISGDVIVASSPDHAYDSSGANALSSAGAAFVFTRSGSTWTQSQVLTAVGTNARAAYANFGNSLAMTADTMVVGATGDSYDVAGNNLLANAGSAFIYVYSAGTWSIQQKIVPTGVNGRQVNDFFGVSVSLSGNLMAVSSSSHGFDANGNALAAYAGAAWVYSRSNAVWTQSQILNGFGVNGTSANSYFGSNVAISASCLAASASSYSYDGTGLGKLNGPGQVFLFKP